MTKEEKQDQDFNAVKTAFMKSFSDGSNRFDKSLKSLVEMREKQITARNRQAVLEAMDLEPLQIAMIKTVLK